MSSILPKQKISKAEKTPDWFKSNVEYRIEQSNFWSTDRWEMIMLYKAATGDLDPSAYKYVLNPYNTPTENLTNYPANMRNVDIISPIIDSYLGEKANKPFNHTVIVSNPNSDNKVKEMQDSEFLRVLAQRYVNDLNASGIETGVPTKEPPSIESILKKYNVDNSDKRAMFGQEALDYIKYHLNLKDKYQEAFYDWLVTGRVFSYKDVYKDDLLHEICPPLEIWHGTTRTGMIEDADWVVRRTRFNLPSCIDRFHEVLKPTEIEALEEKFRNGNTGTTVNTTFTTGTPVIDKAANAPPASSTNIMKDLIDVWHCVWKGYKKVGILKYIDELGQEQEMEVSEDYTLDLNNGDISIEWVYNSVVYEAYKIGDDLYKYTREVLVQRNQLSNSSVVKLPYNGRVGYNERNVVNSVVKKLLNYQALYNIYHFRRELTLARNKDKFMLMPMGLLPSEFGSDAAGMSRYLQFVEATSWAFFDETKPNAISVLQAIKAIDMSLGNYIEGMTRVIESIKMEAWEAVGMNRQRYGDVNSSDGKSVNEQAIFRSAVITRELNRRFEKFEESDIQGLIDYSKAAWINGKKGMYINSEGEKAFLEVNPEEHLDTDYGIFAVDAEEEMRKLEKGKDYAFGWAQKSSNAASMVIEVLDSNNIATLKSKVKEAEDIEKEYQKSIQDANNQNAQMLQDKKDAIEAAKLQNNIDVALIQAKTSLETAQMSNAGQEDTKLNENVLENDLYKVLDTIAKGNENLKKDGIKAYQDIKNTRLKEAEINLKQEKLKHDKTKSSNVK